MIFNSGLHLISNRGTFHRLYRSSHHYLVLTGPVYKCFNYSFEVPGYIDHGVSICY